jgi:hypothetical protein
MLNSTEDAHLKDMSTFETDGHLRGTNVADGDLAVAAIRQGRAVDTGGAGAGSAAIEFFQDARSFAPRSGYVRV